mmetsp:Transcript_22530/g.42339  ORF Transcript_22530/g.42339 Transcript_22530/m.42339 type:complete len:145 (-) Transcript_22530:298-732(-)
MEPSRAPTTAGSAPRPTPQISSLAYALGKAMAALEQDKSVSSKAKERVIPMLPIVAESLGALTQAIEAQKRRHDELIKRGGLIPDSARRPIDPLSFIAAYLMRHNPKQPIFSSKRDAETSTGKTAQLATYVRVVAMLESKLRGD